MYPEQRLPVSLITGFLGSGKTTLLNRLLRDPALADCAVVVNEFGEIGLDHALIESSNDNTILLSSGCLCCTVRGDLVDTLRDLSIKRMRGEVPPFSRVIIETTGLADPAPILHTLMSLPVTRRYALASVVSTVDAVNGETTLGSQPESVKQAAVADRIVITKTDLTGAARIASLRARLAALNPAADILDGASALLPSQLFGALSYDPAARSVDVSEWLRAEAYSRQEASKQGGGHACADDEVPEQVAADPNRHDDRVRAHCFTFDAPLPWRELSIWLDVLVRLRGEDLLRVKGMVNVEGANGPVVVHAVQQLFHPPVELDAWPAEGEFADRRSRIVFITRDMKREDIARALDGVRDGFAEALRAARGVETSAARGVEDPAARGVDPIAN